jgi:hypothetical protein
MINQEEKEDKRDKSRNRGGRLASDSKGSITDRARSMPMIDKYIRSSRRKGSRLTADALSDLESQDSVS